MKAELWKITDAAADLMIRHLLLLYNITEISDKTKTVSVNNSGLCMSLYNKNIKVLSVTGMIWLL